MKVELSRVEVVVVCRHVGQQVGGIGGGGGGGGALVGETEVGSDAAGLLEGLWSGGEGACASVWVEVGVQSLPTPS